MTLDSCGEQVCSGHHPFPSAMRECLESFFDADLSTVSVCQTPAVAALGALAFTVGERLFFAPGRYDVRGHAGIELLGHELAHVLQQRAGRVPEARARLSLVHDPRLEAEADAFGRRLADWWSARPSVHARFAAELPTPIQTAPGRSLVPAVLQARLPGPVAFELFMYYAKAYPGRDDLQGTCRNEHQRLVMSHDTLQSAIDEVHRLVGLPTSQDMPPPGWTPTFGEDAPPPPSGPPSLLSIMQEEERKVSQKPKNKAPKSMAERLSTTSLTFTAPPPPKLLKVDRVKPILDRVAQWDHKSQVSKEVSLTPSEVDDLMQRARQITTNSGNNYKYEVLDNGGTEEKYEYKRVIKIINWYGGQITTGMTGGLKKPTYHVIIKK
ncbi:DUF4157 domain-containing protein [Corallococcus interemptor]|uniref:eCIS core domain-containing protein n=1 Tax=Corallococcus interemptor TaxID=2316720 RepID=UPI003CFC4CBA